MVSKRITAFIICFAMVIGVTGCKDKSRDKDKSEIEKLVSEYSQALKDYDLKALYRISTFEDDENFNWQIPSVMDEQKLIGNNGEEKGKWIFEYYKAIASTITVDYDLEKIEFSGNEATLKVKYHVVFYADLYKGEYADIESLNKQIKEEKDVETFDDTISFMLVDGNWKIVKAKSLILFIEKFTVHYPRLKAQ